MLEINTAPAWRISRSRNLSHIIDGVTQTPSSFAMVVLRREISNQKAISTSACKTQTSLMSASSVLSKVFPRQRRRE